MVCGLGNGRFDFCRRFLFCLFYERPLLSRSAISAIDPHLLSVVGYVGGAVDIEEGRCFRRQLAFMKYPVLRRLAVSIEVGKRVCGYCGEGFDGEPSAFMVRKREGLVRVLQYGPVVGRRSHYAILPQVPRAAVELYGIESARGKRFPLQSPVGGIEGESAGKEGDSTVFERAYLPSVDYKPL